MYMPITIPFGARMILHTLKLKPGVGLDEVELALGEMCNTVRNACGNEQDGFIGGQVFRLSGTLSDTGSLIETADAERHMAIVTYWRDSERNEPHDSEQQAFNSRFSALGQLCVDSRELGYEMLWQGVPE